MSIDARNRACRRLSLRLAAFTAPLLGSAAAFAQDAAAAAPPVVDSGDTAWVLTSTALVLMMTLPGLALF